jgi:hypothetical protein
MMDGTAATVTRERPMLRCRALAETASASRILTGELSCLGSPSINVLKSWHKAFGVTTNGSLGGTCEPEFSTSRTAAGRCLLRPKAEACIHGATKQGEVQWR